MKRGKRERKPRQGLRVRASACATCIYRADSPHDIEALEAEVHNEHGFLTGYRICHHHHGDEDDDVCCRGFWNRHKDDCDVTQIAQRLRVVEFVGESSA